MYYTLKDLRAAGLTIQEIAGILGYTKDAVHKAMKENHREFRFHILDETDCLIYWEIVNEGETEYIEDKIFKKIIKYENRSK